jgi:signal transduction histidine kinase
VVAELSLERLVADLAALGREGEQVLLIDPNGRPLGRPGRVAGLTGQPLPLWPAVGMLEEGGRRFLAAYAPVPVLGWGVVVRQPVSMALAPTERLRRHGLYWGGVGLAVALLLSFLVARDLAARNRELGKQADGIARGRLDGRVAVRSRDELGQLGFTFNRMAGDLQAQRAEIERQSAEIREWNEQLEERVTQKSAELERAQEVVLRSRRLAGLGVLGAGVAHEINNPLATALGYIQLVKHDKALVEGHAAALVEAEKAALRIRGIVHDLLKLAESQTQPLRGVVEPNEVVERALAMTRGSLEERGVELRAELGPGIPAVAGEKEQLTEVLLHLIRNASNAMDGPGALTVRTSGTASQFATIEVADNGRGIPKELVDRVFDPFFTTKEDWEGRGLGLSVAHKIVADHGGRLDIASEVGKGTTVTITLPAAVGPRHLV